MRPGCDTTRASPPNRIQSRDELSTRFRRFRSPVCLDRRPFFTGQIGVAETGQTRWISGDIPCRRVGQARFNDQHKAFGEHICIVGVCRRDFRQQLLGVGFQFGRNDKVAGFDADQGTSRVSLLSHGQAGAGQGFNAQRTTAGAKLPWSAWNTGLLSDMVRILWSHTNRSASKRAADCPRRCGTVENRTRSSFTSN